MFLRSILKNERTSKIRDINTSSRRLANRLFMLRSDRGWSLDELAERSGVSRATLSRIENVETSPTAETLLSLSAAFELSLSRLMSMIEEPCRALLPLEAQEEQSDPAGSVTRRIVSPAAPHLSLEVAEIHQPKETSTALDAQVGTRQEVHVILLDGEVLVTLGTTDYILTAGDCLRYHHTGSVQFQTPPHRGARYLQILI